MDRLKTAARAMTVEVRATVRTAITGASSNADI